MIYRERTESFTAEALQITTTQPISNTAVAASTSSTHTTQNAMGYEHLSVVFVAAVLLTVAVLRRVSRERLM